MAFPIRTRCLSVYSDGIWLYWEFSAGTREGIVLGEPFLLWLGKGLERRGLDGRGRRRSKQFSAGSPFARLMPLTRLFLGLEGGWNSSHSYSAWQLLCPSSLSLLLPSTALLKKWSRPLSIPPLPTTPLPHPHTLRVSVGLTHLLVFLYRAEKLWK